MRRLRSALNSHQPGPSHLAHLVLSHADTGAEQAGPGRIVLDPDLVVHAADQAMGVGTRADQDVLDPRQAQHVVVLAVRAGIEREAHGWQVEPLDVGAAGEEQDRDRVGGDVPQVRALPDDHQATVVERVDDRDPCVEQVRGGSRPAEVHGHRRLMSLDAVQHLVHDGLRPRSPSQHDELLDGGQEEQEQAQDHDGDGDDDHTGRSTFCRCDDGHQHRDVQVQHPADDIGAQERGQGGGKDEPIHLEVPPADGEGAAPRTQEEHGRRQGAREVQHQQARDQDRDHGVISRCAAKQEDAEQDMAKQDTKGDPHSCPAEQKGRSRTPPPEVGIEAVTDDGEGEERPAIRDDRSDEHADDGDGEPDRSERGRSRPPRNAFGYGGLHHQGRAVRVLRRCAVHRRYVVVPASGGAGVPCVVGRLHLRLGEHAVGRGVGDGDGSAHEDPIAVHDAVDRVQETLHRVLAVVPEQVSGQLLPLGPEPVLAGDVVQEAVESHAVRAQQVAASGRGVGGVEVTRVLTPRVRGDVRLVGGQEVGDDAGYIADQHVCLVEGRVQRVRAGLDDAVATRCGHDQSLGCRQRGTGGGTPGTSCRVGLEEQSHRGRGLDQQPEEPDSHPLQGGVVRVVEEAFPRGGIQHGEHWLLVQVGRLVDPGDLRQLWSPDDVDLFLTDAFPRSEVPLPACLSGHPDLVEDPAHRVVAAELVAVSVVDEGMS